MAKTASRFEEADLRRAWSAAKKQGLEVIRTEIEGNGKIVLVHTGEPIGEDLEAEAREWRRKNDRRLGLR